MTVVYFDNYTTYKFIVTLILSTKWMTDSIGDPLSFASFAGNHDVWTNDVSHAYHEMNHLIPELEPSHKQ